MVVEPNGEKQEIREGAKSLVIEDDPDMRFIVKKTLKRLGYEVQAVESRLQGLDAMTGDRFQLAIVNLQMPEMRGEETIREIRKIDPQIFVVVVTGSFAWITEDLEAEIQGWIFKPFRLKELRSLVHEVLGAKRLSDCDHQMAGCAHGR